MIILSLYILIYQVGKPLPIPMHTKILMTDLEPNFMALFSTEVYSSPEELVKDLGLMDIIPGSVIDSKIFEPCGYSLNAIVKVIFC